MKTNGSNALSSRMCCRWSWQNRGMCIHLFNMQRRRKQLDGDAVAHVRAICNCERLSLCPILDIVNNGKHTVAMPRRALTEDYQPIPSVYVCRYFGPPPKSLRWCRAKLYNLHIRVHITEPTRWHRAPQIHGNRWLQRENIVSGEEEERTIWSHLKV